MDNDQFEQVMRSQEYFHALRVLPHVWPVIRVDGRGFTRVTAERGYQKPFDTNFSNLMVEAAHDLMEDLGGVYAYTESDEISVLLPRDTDVFSREVEKLVSISAAIASSTATIIMQRRVQFDARIWLGPNDAAVVDYFRWRQADAERCALNGWAHHTLLKDGLSPHEAHGKLKGLPPSAKHDILMQHNINFNDLPLWQKRGIGLSRELYEKLAHNPKTDEPVLAIRSRIKVDRELPMREDYSLYVRGVIVASEE